MDPRKELNIFRSAEVREFFSQNSEVGTIALGLLLSTLLLLDIQCTVYCEQLQRQIVLCKFRLKRHRPVLV